VNKLPGNQGDGVHKSFKGFFRPLQVIRPKIVRGGAPASGIVELPKIDRLSQPSLRIARPAQRSLPPTNAGLISTTKPRHFSALRVDGRRLRLAPHDRASPQIRNADAGLKTHFLRSRCCKNIAAAAAT
jgi:hypothetical protein